MGPRRIKAQTDPRFNPASASSCKSCPSLGPNFQICRMRASSPAPRVAMGLLWGFNGAWLVGKNL